MTTIDPGKMTDRITLQRRGTPDPWTARDGYSDTATVWAQFRPTTGREFREGSVPVSEERAVFSILHRNNLSTVDRLIHRGNGGNRVWNIQSIVRVGFKEGLDLQCSAVDTAPEGELGGDDPVAIRAIPVVPGDDWDFSLPTFNRYGVLIDLTGWTILNQSIVNGSVTVNANVVLSPGQARITLGHDVTGQAVTLGKLSTLTIKVQAPAGGKVTTIIAKKLKGVAVSDMVVTP